MNTNYSMAERKEFLINMYNQLCSEIDRHINVIWQIIGVLLSTFAIYALVEKNIVPLDVATAILLLVCSLSVAIIIESNYWYNRNLVIIANIERQFLLDTDSKDIHHYFIEHRKNNKYLDMMLIQLFFAFILGIIVLLYHFIIRVYPNFNQPICNFSLIRSLPYLVTIVTFCQLWLFHKKRIEDYNSFKEKSPGIDITVASPKS